MRLLINDVESVVNVFSFTTKCSRNSLNGCAINPKEKKSGEKSSQTAILRIILIASVSHNFA